MILCLLFIFCVGDSLFCVTNIILCPPNLAFISPRKESLLFEKMHLCYCMYMHVTLCVLYLASLPLGHEAWSVIYDYGISWKHLFVFYTQIGKC